MPPRKRGREPEGSTSLPTHQVKTDPEPEIVEVEEEELEEGELIEENDIETKDGKNTNVEKEAKGESERHAELLLKPPHGSEVHIGGVPAGATKEELEEFFKACGEVLEVRIGRNKNKRYAFVSFRTVDEASKAIKELHYSEFKGKKVSCTMSHRNIIHIRNIPRNWEESEMKNAVEQVGPGVIHVDVMKESSISWGFVEYCNHACADNSLKEMSKPDFKLGTDRPIIDWAEPRVKAMYVKNLPKDVTDEQIKELFERHGNIDKVVLRPLKAGYETRYGSVYFMGRASALKAVQNTEPYELGGQVLDCSLAMLPADMQPETGATMHHGMNNPVMAPPGMAMVPEVLPDGSLGYVMQQPALDRAHNRGNNRGGGRGSGGGRARRP